MNNWITEFEIKTTAEFSNVVLVETNDRKRYEQFLVYAVSENEDRFDNVYTFDNLHALRKVGATETNPAFGDLEFEPISMNDDFSIDNKMNIAQVIEYIHELNGNPSVFVFDINVSEMGDMIRDLAIDQDLTISGTKLVFMSPSVKELKEHVRNLSINLKPAISTFEERERILSNIANEFKIELSETVINSTSGLNLHETQSIGLESYVRTQRFDERIISDYKKQAIERSGLLELLPPLKEGLEGIGGYQDVKDLITDNIISVIANPQEAKNFGVEIPRGILLFGMPGTGKTLMVRAMAQILNIPALLFKQSAIKSKWVGESQSNLDSALELAEALSPCILLFDEIDQLGKREATTSTSSVDNDLFTRLLSWMGDQERKTIVVGTTNEPDKLDEAMIRAGRMDNIICMFNPDEKAREEIFRVHCEIQRNLPITDEVDYSQLANETEYYTGAEIELICKRASAKAFQNRHNQNVITMNNFMEAISDMKIDLGRRQKILKKYLGLAQKYVNDKSFLSKLEEKAKSRIEQVAGRIKAK